MQIIEAVSRIGLLAGGSIGLYLAWMRVVATNRQAEAQIRQADAATKQAEIGRRKLATDVFQQAVEQLGNEKIEIRLFAIYSLRHIIDTYPEDKTAVLALLAQYVRQQPQKWGESDPPVDVQEIFKILESNLKEVT